MRMHAKIVNKECERSMYESFSSKDALLNGVKLFSKNAIASGEKQFALSDEAFVVEKKKSKSFGRKKSASLDEAFVDETKLGLLAGK